MRDNRPKNSQKRLTKQEKREKREEALDQIFGKDRKEYMGNIWGWKFSIMSLIGLSIISLIAIYGVYTGKINVQQQLFNPASDQIEKRIPQKNTPTQDSAKLN